jgi:hypothetical protein
LVRGPHQQLETQSQMASFLLLPAGQGPVQKNCILTPLREPRIHPVDPPQGRSRWRVERKDFKTCQEPGFAPCQASKLDPLESPLGRGMENSLDIGNQEDPRARLLIAGPWTHGIWSWRRPVRSTCQQQAMAQSCSSTPHGQWRSRNKVAARRGLALLGICLHHPNVD